MYDEKLKLLAKKIDLVHLPDEFKFETFGEGENEVDAMELYEELFDYSYAVAHDQTLGSNFNVFLNHREKVFNFLLAYSKDEKIGEVCSVCYEFCVAISDILFNKA